jgi:hypothetical protein
MAAAVVGFMSGDHTCGVSVYNDGSSQQQHAARIGGEKERGDVRYRSRILFFFPINDLSIITSSYIIQQQQNKKTTSSFKLMTVRC